MKGLAKRLMRVLFRDYQINCIYSRDLPAADTVSDASGAIRRLQSPQAFAAAADRTIRDHAWYFGERAVVYGVYEGADLVAICAFWLPGHARMPRRFRALAHDEAVMVDLLTAPQSRGKGYALAVTRFAERDLRRQGYRRLRTWVWHSNAPSHRVFNKAGWHCTHLLVELQLPGMSDYLRFKLPAPKTAQGRPMAGDLPP